MTEPAPPPPPPPAPPPGGGARIPPCPDCGGRRVGNLGLVAAQAGHTNLLPFGRTRFWGTERVCGLQAYACLNCGLVKLYTDDVAALREATSKHPEWFRW